MATRIDLEKATERAWEVLRFYLERRLEGFGEDDVLELDMEGPEREQPLGTPYVRVRLDDGLYLVEVPRNRGLGQRYRLRRTGREELEALSFERSRGGPCWLGVGVDPADAVAMTLGALRNVWAVPHPSFLVDSDDLVEDDMDDEPESDAGHGVPEPKRLGHRPSYAKQEIWPTTEAQLQEAVDSTLSHDLGCQVAYDADGDAPFRVDESVVFVGRVTGESVGIFCDLVVDARDHRLAVHEVNILNRDVPHFKFVLTGDRITMHLGVPTQPFVPARLIEMLELAMGVVRTAAPDVAFRVRGRCFLENAEHLSDEDGVA